MGARMAGTTLHRASSLPSPMHQEHWYLEGYLGGDNLLRRIPIRQFPFRIGRDSELDFMIPGSKVSRQHAEILLDGNRLLLRDNNSTNGSFVNRQRINGEAELHHGDVLHFGDTDLRLIRETIKKSMEQTQRQAAVGEHPALSDKMPTGIRELQELLQKRMVMPAFQPIVDAITGATYGYEVLGRGTHPALPPNPGGLFRIAESVDSLSLHLSQLFREIGIATAARFNSSARFFMNVHPDELKYARLLLLQMERLRRDYPGMALVLEIHEKAVPKLSDMKKICRELEGMDIRLAYDDFGAGQARFIELIEAPAHYLKFDMSLLQHIDTAPDAKRDMVQSLVNLSHKMQIITLAEGLERREEVECCQAMGFDLIQGYYYGEPTLGSL